MPKIIIMIGTPGSGKSTHVEKLKKTGNFVVLSSDAIRKELCGDEADQSKNREIFQILYKSLYKAMREKKDIIIDATNISKLSRECYLDAATRYKYEKVAYFINTPIEDCIKNNGARTRVVAETIVLRFYNRLQPPTIEEGFDVIHIVNYKKQPNI